MGKFVDDVYKLTTLLENFPELGMQAFDSAETRVLFIKKYTKIYYRIEGDQILILNVFDTRRDPGSKPS